jgi:tetratricopeptide (TPR) repeat protein
MKFTIEKFIKEAEDIANMIPERLGLDLRRGMVVANLIGHATIYKNEGDYDAMAAFAKDIVQVRPDLYEFWWVYGLALHGAGRMPDRDQRPYFDHALASFEKYEEELAKQPPLRDTERNHLDSVEQTRAEIYYEDGRYLAAIEAADAAEKLANPENASLRPHWSRGQSYLEMKLPDRALPYLQKVAESDPDTSEISAKLGDAYWMSGDIESARSLYRSIDKKLAAAGRPPYDWGLRDEILAVLPLERADAPSEAQIYQAIARAFPRHAPARAGQVAASRMFGLIKGKAWTPSLAAFSTLSEEIENVPFTIKFFDKRVHFPRTGELMRSTHWCDDAFERTFACKSYVLITSHAKAGDDMRRVTRVIMKLTAELAKDLKPVGIVWDTAKAFWPVEPFIASRSKDVSDMPPAFQFASQYGATAIAIKHGADAAQPKIGENYCIWYRSEGLKVFGLKEVEARGFAGTPLDGALMMMGLVSYLLSSDAEIKDGETFGHDGPGAAKHKIRIGPSTLVGREESYILELDGLSNVMNAVH